VIVARVAMVVVAVAAVVLLADRLSVARDVARAEAIGPADAPRAQRLLEHAAARTSDTTPLLREAQLMLFAGRPRDAIDAAQRATRAEPDNAQAWLLLSQAAAGSDRRVAAEAQRRLRALVRSPGNTGPEGRVPLRVFAQRAKPVSHPLPQAAARRARRPRA
jgi:tetratricopeptide repeat protein